MRSNNLNIEQQELKFDLNRFVTAQESVYPQVISELKNGRKQSHWMWYIFPQIDGLGKSETAKQYAIKSLDEARTYLHHPILGQRLLECSSLLLDIQDKTAENIFGFPDCMKLQSCMTLFWMTMPPGSIFKQVMAKYYKNEKDCKTIELIS